MRSFFNYLLHQFTFILSMIKTVALFSFFLFSLSISSLAQKGQDRFLNNSELEKYKVIHHGVEDGLSQGTAYSILKDSRGFMWFTSYEGLNRFDGHQFTVYSESPNDNKSIKGSQTFGLVEDPYGNIWTGTDICLNQYLRKSDQFDFVFMLDKNGLNQASVNYPFYADSTEVWYINNKEGILAYDFIKKQKRTISSDFLYRHSSYIINSTLCTQDGKIWYRDEIGLACIDPDTGKYKWYFSNNANNVLGNPTKINCFYQDKDGVIWLGYGNGIIRYNFDADHLKKINLDQQISTPVVDIQKDSQGFLWLGTEQDGLIQYSESQGIINHFRAKGTSRQRLTSNGITSVFVDDQDLVWINTDPEGIDLLIPDLKPFKRYSSDFFDPLFFSTKGVRCFLETSNENIWIGTQEDGLIIFDPTLDQIKERIIPGDRGFTPNSATCMIQDTEDRIWVGTYDGLYLSKNQGKSFQKIINHSRKQNTVSSNFISDLIELPNKTIVFGSEEGIYYIPNNQYDPIAIDTLQTIVSGKMYLSGNSHLIVSENHKGFHILKISEWFNNNFPKPSNKQAVINFLPQYNVKHYYEPEGNDTLWIATNTGLIKARHTENWSQLEIIKNYTRDNGLPSNYIYSVIPDDDQRLWLSTNRGISCFNPKSESFVNYSIDDGLQGFEFNTNSFLKTIHGEFYFGGTNGFNRFHPNFKKNKTIPRLQITGLKVNDKPFQKVSYIGEQTYISLSSEENTFSIQFSAVDYQSNGKNKYRVFLENYDESWNDLGFSNSIRYTKVPPGDYHFKLAASNNDDIWTNSIRTLNITVATPWYNTSLAYLAYLLLIGFLFFQIYKIRLRRKILKHQLLSEQEEALRLKELDTFKTRFYSNITHEFRTPLTVIQGMADELKKKPEQQSQKKLNLIIKNSRNLLSLVNQMLDLSRLQAGKLSSDLSQEDIIAFLKYLVESHESFAKLQTLGLQFYSEEQELVMDFDAKKLERVITNLLSNAIKFTPEHGKILVVAKKVNKNKKQLLQIKIKDSGIGISAEQLPYIFDRFHQTKVIHNNQGTGIGLALVKELTDIMKGTIQVESELNKGTTFLLNLPIQHLAPLSTRTYQHEFTPIHILENATKQESLLSDNDLPILLIIEDNVDVTYYIQTCLEDQYQILTCPDGKSGVEKALEVLPDIIISDIMMPEMNGFEVCKKLKADERSSHIPIILLTAKTNSKDKIAGLSHGADAYLTKPFEKEELIVRLDKLLQVRKTLQLKYSNTLISSSDFQEITKHKEDSFIQKVENILLKHLSDEDFSTNELARELHLSRSQVHRKLKALTGMSSSIYVRHIRLQKAKVLLASSELSISEIAYQVGFKTPVYFSQVFKETFGKSPNAVRKE